MDLTNSIINNLSIRNPTMHQSKLTLPIQGELKVSVVPGRSGGLTDDSPRDQL